jgi:hypothetical protein
MGLVYVVGIYREIIVVSRFLPLFSSLFSSSVLTSTNDVSSFQQRETET